MQFARCFDGTEDPEEESLHNDQRSCANTKGKIDANVLANLGIHACPLIDLRPSFEPKASRNLGRLGGEEGHEVHANCNEVALLGVAGIDGPLDLTLLGGFFALLG